MAFDNSYRHALDRDGKGKKGPDSCILPFFGFKYGSDTDSYSQGVYIRDPNELSGQRKVYGTHSLEVEVFSRPCAPEGKALQLEEKFISLAKKHKNYTDPWKMPYVPTSLKDYYNTYVNVSATGIGCVIGLVLTVLWFVFYGSIFPLFKAKFGYDLGCVLFVFGGPVGLCLLGIVGGLIVDLIKKLTHTAPTPYNEMNPTEKAEAKEKYYRHMVDLYGSEAGEVLKEYAALKGYDC